MTVTSKVLVQGKRVENTPTQQYVSANCQTIIDSGIVTNTSGAPVTLNLWLVAVGNTQADETLIAKAVSIAAGATYPCPELAGKRLDAGDMVWAEASAVTSLSFRMDGRQITAA